MDKTISRRRFIYDQDIGTLREIKITMINMTKTILGRMDNMQKQWGISAKKWKLQNDMLEVSK